MSGTSGPNSRHQPPGRDEPQEPPHDPHRKGYRAWFGQFRADPRRTSFGTPQFSNIESLARSAAPEASQRRKNSSSAAGTTGESAMTMGSVVGLPVRNLAYRGAMANARPRSVVPGKPQERSRIAYSMEALRQHGTPMKTASSVREKNDKRGTLSLSTVEERIFPDANVRGGVARGVGPRYHQSAISSGRTVSAMRSAGTVRGSRTRSVRGSTNHGKDLDGDSADARSDRRTPEAQTPT